MTLFSCPPKLLEGRLRLSNANGVASLRANLFFVARLRDVVVGGGIYRKRAAFSMQHRLPEALLGVKTRKRTENLRKSGFSAAGEV
jgi:hypothetical protein